MFARIPALLLEGTTKAEIAAMYGVTLGTLVVLCCRRGISLRKGAPHGSAAEQERCAGHGNDGAMHDGVADPYDAALRQPATAGADPRIDDTAAHRKAGSRPAER